MDTLCQKNRVAVKSLIFTILCGVVVLMHVKLCFGQSTTIAIRTVVQYESTVVVRTRPGIADEDIQYTTIFLHRSVQYRSTSSSSFLQVVLLEEALY